MELGQNSVKGTKFKLNVNMSPIDGFHLSGIEWQARVWTETSSKAQICTKNESTYVDDDNYMIKVDSAIVGAGVYNVTIYANIPDEDFEDGMRPEVRTAFNVITVDPR